MSSNLKIVKLSLKIKKLYDQIKTLKSKKETRETRAGLIKKASVVGIGESEDEAKERVRRLFKKNNSIDYSKIDKEYIHHQNKKYEEDKKRLLILQDKDFEWSFNGGEELSESEKLEYQWLLKTIGHTLNSKNVSLDSINLVDLYVGKINRNIEKIDKVYLDEIEIIYSDFLSRNVMLDSISHETLFTYSKA